MLVALFLLSVSFFLPKDAELPPIMEEGEPTSTLVYNHQLPQGNISSSDMQTSGSVVSEAMSGYPLDNEERAIVLYKPVETPLILSPGPDNVSLRVSLDFIDGIRRKFLKPSIALILACIYLMVCNVQC